MGELVYKSGAYYIITQDTNTDTYIHTHTHFDIMSLFSSPWSTSPGLRIDPMLAATTTTAWQFMYIYAQKYNDRIIVQNMLL